MRLIPVPILVLSAVALFSACNSKQEDAKTQGAANTNVMTEEDKTFYALGALISENLRPFDLSEKELERVKQGLSDGVNQKTLQVDVMKYRDAVQRMHQTRMLAQGKKEAEEGKAFLTKAATEQGAARTASGLVVTHLKEGAGASPKSTDQVKVHYQGTLINGKVFDSSIQRGEPVTFPLNGVIPCWTEGLQLMKVGGKSKLVCPSEIAYGERGAPPDIKPGATLVFEVELLEIVK